MRGKHMKLLDDKVYSLNYPLKDNDFIQMFEILVNNMKKNLTFVLNTDDFYIWKKNIQNSIDLNTILLRNDNSIFAYIQFIKSNNKICICEIQIDDNHKGDRQTFRRLLNDLVKECNINNQYLIYGNINKNNKKSLAVFTGVGFINIKNNRYEITGQSLLDWFKNED